MVLTSGSFSPMVATTSGFAMSTQVMAMDTIKDKAVELTRSACIRLWFFSFAALKPCKSRVML
jgi:hypothetical protein